MSVCMHQCMYVHMKTLNIARFQYLSYALHTARTIIIGISNTRHLNVKGRLIPELSIHVDVTRSTVILTNEVLLPWQLLGPLDQKELANQSPHLVSKGLRM